MNDLDPNFLIPVWRAVVRYFRAYKPIVHSLGDCVTYPAAHPAPPAGPPALSLRGRSQLSAAHPPVAHAPQQLALELPAPERRKARKARQMRRSSYMYLRALERQLPHQPSP